MNYDSKLLDRNTYRSIKRMSNEEMTAFLNNHADKAVKDYQKENGLDIRTDEKGHYIGMSRDLFKHNHSEIYGYEHPESGNIYCSLRNES